MSIESMISGLVTEVKKLASEVAGKAKEIDTRVNAAVKAIPEMHKSYFIDALNGNDQNLGTRNEPLKTILEASNRTSRNGSVGIALMRGQDHNMTGGLKEFIDCDQKTITFGAYGSGDDPVITMTTGAESTGGDDIAYGYRVSTYARFLIVGCVIDTMSLTEPDRKAFADYGGFASRSSQTGQVGEITLMLARSKIILRDHQFSSHYGKIEYALREVEIEFAGIQNSLVGVNYRNSSVYIVSASDLTLSDSSKSIENLFPGINKFNSITNILSE